MVQSGSGGDRAAPATSAPSDPRHELNNRLTVILTSAELATRALDGSAVDIELVRGHLASIRDNALAAARSVRCLERPASHEAAPLAPVLPTHVLLVEDDELVRETYLDALQFHGHGVVAACSGAEALSWLAGSRFDVMITDLNMPGMSGLELARQAKELAPELPVVLISGWTGQHGDERVEHPHVDHVVDKPCAVQDLVALIERITP